MTKSNLILIWLSFHFIGQTFGQVCRCNVRLYRRQACQSVPPNVSEQNCLAAGCCYDSRTLFYVFRRVSNCYSATGICPRFTCEINPEDREECGNYFRFACQIRACCYNSYSVPRCFRRKAITTTVVTTTTTTTTTRTATVTSTVSDTAQNQLEWMEWGEWSECSESCSPGTRTRRRSCTKEEEQQSSKVCDGEDTERRECNTDMCLEWGPWTDNTACLASCGEFQRVSVSRSCLGLGSLGDIRCRSNIRICTRDNCNPFWSTWMAWTRCSRVGCRPGNRSRYRMCMIGGFSVDTRRCIADVAALPRPDLQEQARQIEPCNIFLCTTWTPWSQFGECVPSCAVPGVSSIRNGTRRCSSGTDLLPSNERERRTYQNCAIRSLHCVPRSCEDELTSPDASVANVSFTPITTPVMSKRSTPIPDTSTTITNTSQSTTPEAITAIAITASSATPTVVPTTTETSTTTTSEPSAATTTSSNTSTIVWSEWSPCTETCGPGSSIRITLCVLPDGKPAETFQECDAESRFEQRECNTDHCREWGEWREGECIRNCTNDSVSDPPIGFSTQLRPCLSGSFDAVPSECFSDFTSCIPSLPCPTSPITPAARMRNWGRWSECSETCGVGERYRNRTCENDENCSDVETEQEACNTEYCESWSTWSSTCSERCGGGRSVYERVCNSNSTITGAISDECFQRNIDEPCNTEVCDEDVDILFLVDSSDFVDGCRQLRRNFSIPISSQFINENTTPVYAKIKEFLSQFVQGWRTVDDGGTHMGIQLYSRACSSSNKRNFYLEKSFNDTHENLISDYIDTFPYRCGNSYLDLALTCAETSTFTPSRGDRERVPNVLVALISRVPQFAQPISFLLTAISQRIKDSGTTIITGGVTPSESISSSSARMQYESMLTNLACQRPGRLCPTYIGSIWDEDRGTPAERIRTALKQADET